MPDAPERGDHISHVKILKERGCKICHGDRTAPVPGKRRTQGSGRDSTGQGQINDEWMKSDIYSFMPQIHASLCLHFNYILLIIFFKSRQNAGNTAF